MKLRILIVSDNYPPFIGGAHRQTQLLGRELGKRGHAVQVATLWHPDVPAHEDDQGMQVHRLKQTRNLLPWFNQKGQQYQPPFPDPVTIWGLRRVIDDFQPDVIHAYGWITYSLAVALWGKQIPLLVSGRDYAFSCATRTLIYKGQELCHGPAPIKCLQCASHLYGPALGWTATLGVALGRRLLNGKIQGIHSISTYVQEISERDFLGKSSAGAAKDNASIIRAIIPSFRESEATEKYSEDPQIQRYLEPLPKEPYILFVGALRRVKGIEQLLAAYQRLQSPPPLVLIGTFETDSPREFPPGVVVLEKYPHRAVMAAWEGALFGVIPSLWPEPLGSVVYEGMTCGKAMIGTKPGGHTDMIIDGETGSLVPIGDIEALTKAMQTLIDQPDLCQQFGTTARVRAGQFTADVNVPRFEQLYWRLVTNSVGRAEEQDNPLQLSQR